MFDPSIRYQSDKVKQQAEKILGSRFFTTLLEDVPLMLVIINSARQVVYANNVMLNRLDLHQQNLLLGKRPGECLGCIYAKSAEHGCGSTPYCSVCGFANAILSSELSENGQNECAISLPDGQNLLFNVRTRAFNFESERFIFCTM